MSNNERIVLLDAFYGGSHRQHLDHLHDVLVQRKKDSEVQCIVMSDKKWHWRMRTSAMYFATEIEKIPSPVRTLFVSSVINLAELVGLCTAGTLQEAHKILYFHENQLIYLVRKHQERDFQYGYNQIVSCLVADEVLFNSEFNMKSFLDNIQHYLKLMPDYRPKDLKAKIEPKCRVLYYLFSLPKEIRLIEKEKTEDSPLHIVWPHRWVIQKEHDKNPEEFFQVLFQLQEEKLVFQVSVLGQMYTDVPDIFKTAKEQLKEHIVNWGYQESKEVYFSVLSEADVVVSTALHEFFGVSMLEAVSLKCYPLCPNRLVYPEIFPGDYLYNTKQQLYKRLKRFCKHPELARRHRVKIDLSPFNAGTLKEEYLKLFDR